MIDLILNRNAECGSTLVQAMAVVVISGFIAVRTVPEFSQQLRIQFSHQAACVSQAGLVEVVPTTSTNGGSTLGGLSVGQQSSVAPVAEQIVCRRSGGTVGSSLEAAPQPPQLGDQGGGSTL